MPLLQVFLLHRRGRVLRAPVWGTTVKQDPDIVDLEKICEWNCTRRTSSTRERGEGNHRSGTRCASILAGLVSITFSRSCARRGTAAMLTGNSEAYSTDQPTKKNIYSYDEGGTICLMVRFEISVGSLVFALPTPWTSDPIVHVQIT